MPTWIKWTCISLIAVIVTMTMVSSILYKYNSKFSYWWELPLENRLLSIQLEIERPFNHYLFSTIEESQYPIVSKDSLTSSIKLGAQWIMNMQEESGRFNYWYDPEKEIFSSKSDDNFLRQAGTNYSLLTAFEVLHDSTLLQASLLNLKYLNRFLIEHDPDTAYYLYRKKAKLGGIALPMLVMLKLREIRNDTIYDQYLHSLANMILGLQEMYGTGQFKSTYIYNGSFQYEKEKGWESNIYPGEAMLALAEMYNTFDNPKYLESLEHAVEFYSKDSNWKHFSFMPWATIAMSKVALSTDNSIFSDFAFMMTDRILYWQNTDPKSSSVGSLFGVPTVFTATWMEGVGASLVLAKHLKDEKRVQLYRKQLLLSFNWLLQLQYSKTNIVKLNYSADALGGFRRSLIEPEIRIDNTQHAISSMIKAVKYLNQE